MDIKFTPQPKINNSCLVLVGGSGDTIELFQPLANALAEKLPNYSICTFSFSSISKEKSIFELQTYELEEVFSFITHKKSFKKVLLWSTSMGVFSTIKLLNNSHFSKKINKVILFDPADYYLNDSSVNSEQDITWSGSRIYDPNKPTIRSLIKNIKGTFTIDVFHLTLRNYGKKGYIEKDYIKRGGDNPTGFPRLNTNMVKSFHVDTPDVNRGKYLEIPDIPHGFVRDGNINKNIENVAKIISTTILNDQLLNRKTNLPLNH
jgi:hypothetical protein